MKSKDQQLLEEAYTNVNQNEVARRQQQMEERLPHLTKTLEGNKNLKFEDKKSFYNWRQENLPSVSQYALSDLHPVLGPELEKAHEAGYNSEDYTCPFPEKTLWWWMAELSAHQGAMDV
jgi:hypothetical protein